MARKWWTLTAVCVGVFMLLLDVTIVNVALPDIQSRFHASLADLQWVIDAYALTLAAVLLTAGSLADLWGRRAMFAAGNAHDPLVLYHQRRGGEGIGGVGIGSLHVPE